MKITTRAIVVVASAGVFACVCPVRAGALPQNEPWHKALRNYMAALTVKDFQLRARPLPPRPPAQTQPADRHAKRVDLYKAWLLTMPGIFPPSRGCFKVPPEQFVLTSIETPEGVIIPGGLPISSAWLAQWDDPVNPYFGSDALKRRSFVTAAVDMIMLDDLHGRNPDACRSDYLGGTLIWLAYSHIQFKDILPAEVREAYETGLRRMAGKILKWGPTGEMTDMDMRAPIGLIYTARALGDEKLAVAAKEYARKMFASTTYYNPAGYFVDFGCFDVSYNGMATYFATWLALITDWPFVTDALEQNYRLRSHLILPEPVGDIAFGPSHCSPRTSAGSYFEQWNWPFRHIAAAMITDEAMFRTPMPVDSHMRGKYNNLGKLMEAGSPGRSRKWIERHWSRSINFAHDYYKPGFLERRTRLGAEKSELLLPTMLRRGDFVRKFGDVFLIAKFGDFGAVVHTGPVGGERPLQGFGGGCLSAIWTRQTGPAILARRRGYEGGPGKTDLLSNWRNLPIHSISGETDDGTLVMSARIRKPRAQYKVGKTSGEVLVSAPLQARSGEKVNKIAGNVKYRRRFAVSAEGLTITSRLVGDGKTVMKELYESIPVFLREVRLQSRPGRNPQTTIHFLCDGKWAPATPEPRKITEARIDRWGHSLRVVFDRPVTVRLSPKQWQDNYQSQVACRNILIDMLDGGGPKRLGTASVTYRIDSRTAPAARAAPIWKAKDLNPVTFHKAPNHEPVVLVKDGKALGKIVIMAPKRTEKRYEAVQRLQQIIKQATGAELEIVRGKIDAPAIVIGDCQLAARHGLVGKDLPIEGFAIKTAPGYVFIVGNPTFIPAEMPANADAWGVYEFAERFLGARWYFPDPEIGLSVAKSKDLVIPPVHLTDQPFFRKRHIWPNVSDSWHGRGVKLEPLQAFLRNGNSWPIQGRGHAPFWWMDKEFCDANRDLFELRQDGTRDERMVCYGNPRTLEKFLELLAEHFSKDPTPYRADIRRIAVIGDTITVSPWDKAVTCRCEYCRKLWDPDAGGYGTASRILTTFVAKLAREVKKRWPGKNVLYIPYQNYTMAPDGIDLPDNVTAEICGMPGLALYAQKEVRESEQANIDTWIKMTGHKVLNWHYSCWPLTSTQAPYQYPHVIKDFYQRNRDKVVGSFINGEFDHWPRSSISLYCWMKVLWNPDYDVDAACDTFCERMFGAAAAPMRKLLQMQMDGWEKAAWPSGRISLKAIFEISYPRPMVVEMEGLLAQSRELTKDDPLVTKRLDYYGAALEEFFKQSRQVAEGTALVPLVTQKSGEGPVIDGKLNDEVWKGAEPNKFVRALDKERSEPFYPTTIRSVATAKGIYFGFHMVEPTPDRLEVVNGGRDNPELWWDDNVEIIIDVTGKNEGEYYHLMINAKGDLFDAKAGDVAWTCKGIQRAAHVGKDFWSLEVFLPYAAFDDAVVPKSGSNLRWHGSFTRHRVADCGREPKAPRAEGSVREYQRMNTTYANYSTNLEDFAEIQFRE